MKRTLVRSYLSDFEYTMAISRCVCLQTLNYAWVELSHIQRLHFFNFIYWPELVLLFPWLFPLGQIRNVMSINHICLKHSNLFFNIKRFDFSLKHELNSFFLFFFFFLFDIWTNAIVWTYQKIQKIKENNAIYYHLFNSSNSQYGMHR